MTKQKFLLQEVIDDLVNTDKSLSAALMKLNYFGKLIKNQDLIDYTHHELNGYRDDYAIPAYRKSPGTILIDIQAYMNRHNDLRLPLSMIEQSYQHVLKYVHIREGIAGVEKFAKDSERGKGGQIIMPLPMEMLHVFQEPARKLYESDVEILVVDARLAGMANVAIEIPNAIRTKLLDFVMSIAETIGYDIEIETFNKKAETNNQTIIQQMNNIINNTGDGNMINTGDHNEIKNEVTLYKGDLHRLQSELKKQGIDEADIQEISEIVKSEQPDTESGRLGEKSKNWIMKIIGKSLDGIGKVAIGISSNLLAALIRQYYGMP